MNTLSRDTGTSDFVRRLKERANIVEVIGEFVRLKKSGANHVGLCPFHAERSPSFSVNGKKGIFYCFGCQKGGDVLNFLQEIQALSFTEAVKLLASRIGIKPPPEFLRSSRSSGSNIEKRLSAGDSKIEIFFKLNRFVAQFFHENLKNSLGQGAREYLFNRGVSNEMIERWYLGYAPDSWSSLVEFLESRSAPLDIAEQLGLIKKKETPSADGRLHYDVFRNRVVFPVIDLRGRVVAFGARVLDDSASPKYLNSPETPVFKKGDHLYGLFAAQRDIRAEGRIVVVEGYLDCIALHQGGLECTVATLGTALTPRQVQLIKKLSRDVVLFFDGDHAGQEASKKAMELFLEQQVVARGASIPDGLDPDEFIRERGVEEMRVLLNKAPFLLDSRILEIVSEAGAHIEGKSRAIQQILPWLSKLPPDAGLAYRIDHLAGLLGVPAESISKQLHTREGRRNYVGSALTKSSRISSKPINDKIDPIDQRVLELLVAVPEMVELIENKEKFLAGLVSEVVRDVASQYLFGGEKGFPSILENVQSPEIRRTLMASSVRPLEKTGEIFQEFRHLVAKLIRRGLENRKDALRAIILRADGSGSSLEFDKLMGEYHELVRYLDETKGGQSAL